MFEQFYADSELMTWPLVGLFIFVAAFVAVVLFVFVGLRNSRAIDHLAQLPLETESTYKDDKGGK